MNDQRTSLWSSAWSPAVNCTLVLSSSQKSYVKILHGCKVSALWDRGNTKRCIQSLWLLLPNIVMHRARVCYEFLGFNPTAWGCGDEACISLRHFLPLRLHKRTPQFRWLRFVTVIEHHAAFTLTITPPVAFTTDRRFAGSIEFLFGLRTRLCIGLWHHDPLGTPVLCSGPGPKITSLWITDPGTGWAGPVPGPGCGLGPGGEKGTTRRRDSGALARSTGSRRLWRFFAWGVVWIRALLHCRSAFLKCVEGIRSCEAFFGAVGSERVRFFVCIMAPAIAALQVVHTLTSSIVLVSLL
jgi:hypothetical protein